MSIGEYGDSCLFNGDCWDGGDGEALVTALFEAAEARGLQYEAAFKEVDRVEENGEVVSYEGAVYEIKLPLAFLSNENIPELEPAAEIYYVTCRNLNVRAGGSTSYKKVDMIHRGDAVKVLEIKNGWAKLDNGTYVCAKYIAK